MVCRSSSANSAEPPSIVIIVNNPPENLSISLEDTMTKAIVYKKAWEAQYSFYSRDLRGNSSHTLIVSNDTDSDYYKIDVPVQSYRNIYTLDIKNKIITPGIHPLRSVILVSLRVFLTLLIEGCIFWLFGFRGKKSWVLFLVINLVTQGALNLWLDSFAITQSYLILALFVGEVLVFITEIALFSIAVKNTKCRENRLCTFRQYSQFSRGWISNYVTSGLTYHLLHLAWNFYKKFSS